MTAFSSIWFVVLVSFNVYSMEEFSPEQERIERKQLPKNKDPLVTIRGYKNFTNFELIRGAWQDAVANIPEKIKMGRLHKIILNRGEREKTTYVIHSVQGSNLHADVYDGLRLQGWQCISIEFLQAQIEDVETKNGTFLILSAFN